MSKFSVMHSASSGGTQCLNTFSFFFLFSNCQVRRERDGLPGGLRSRRQLGSHQSPVQDPGRTQALWRTWRVSLSHRARAPDRSRTVDKGKAPEERLSASSGSGRAEQRIACCPHRSIIQLLQYYFIHAFTCVSYYSSFSVSFALCSGNTTSYQY